MLMLRHLSPLLHYTLSSQTPKTPRRFLYGVWPFPPFFYPKIDSVIHMSASKHKLHFTCSWVWSTAITHCYTIIRDWILHKNKNLVPRQDMCYSCSVCELHAPKSTDALANWTWAGLKTILGIEHVCAKKIRSADTWRDHTHFSNWETPETMECFQKTRSRLSCLVSCLLRSHHDGP